MKMLDEMCRRNRLREEFEAAREEHRKIINDSWIEYASRKRPRRTTKVSTSHSSEVGVQSYQPNLED